MRVPTPNFKVQPSARHLAFKTIDSYIGKLRAIFKEAGRCGDWNLLLGLGNPAASLEVQKYLKASTEEILRAQAFFKALFFSGDRGSDLGMVKTEEILRFPQDDGLLFNHVWGKTLRDGTSNVFGIRRHPNPELCPVKAIETYVAVA